MSTYDDASLIMFPSGYKEDKIYSLKPTDGSGDLTFTRASSATRVNSDGLIETASVFGSEEVTNGDFATDTDWNKGSGSTISGGNLNIISAPYNATTRQTISLTSGITYQILINATAVGSATANTFQLGFGDSSGAPSSATQHEFAVGISTKTLTVTASATDTTIIFRSRDAGTSNLTIHSVSVKEVITLNVPRIDYTGGGCGKLLLEPQRTNLALYSEQPDNVYWTKSGATILTNTINSPSGYVDADKLQEDSSTGVHRYGRATFPSGTQRTFSVFAKKGERDYVSLFENNAVAPQIKGVIFDLNTGALSLNNDAAYYTNPTITDYGNGWYRCSATWTPLSLSVPSIGVSADGLTNSYAGTTGSGIFVWGAQLEAGSYSTSYIKSEGAATTRLADSCSKTGISDKIGQTEGVLYADIDFKANTGEVGVIIEITSGAAVQRVLIYYNSTTILCYANAAVFSYSQTTSERLKIAFAYKSGDSAFYVNGVQKAVSSASLSYSSLSQLVIGNNLTFTQPTNSPTNQALLFKTRLTNAELATLTTL